MKLQLEIGDKIRRYDIGLTREIDYVYIIDSVTKTLAKSGITIFKRDLIYGTTTPKNPKNKVLARVYTKDKQNWSSPDYFLIEND